MAPYKRCHVLVSRPVFLAREGKRSHLDAIGILQVSLRDCLQYSKELRIRFHVRIIEAEVLPQAVVYKKAAHINEPRHRVSLRTPRNMRTAETFAQKTGRINFGHQKVNRTDHPRLCKMRNPRRTQLDDIGSLRNRIRKRPRNFVKRLAPVKRSQLHRNPRLAIELFHKTVQRNP